MSIEVQVLIEAQVAHGFSNAYERRAELRNRVWELSPAERKAIGFTSRMFVQANLPHSDPGDQLDAWVRRNGTFVLTIQQGIKIDSRGKPSGIGYPYGSIPRLIMIYLATEAVRTKAPRIELGRSLSQFMRRIRLDGNGRSIRRFKQQLHRLLAANIHVSYENASVIAGSTGNIADEYAFWWDDKRPTQNTLWTSHVTLNQRFFEEVVDGGFPLDLDAVAGIKKSPLALDLYGWLAHRMHGMRKPAWIPWASLHRQLGSDYKDVADFKKRALKALMLVRAFWPDLEYRRRIGKLGLIPSPTPVPQLPTKSLIP